MALALRIFYTGNADAARLLLIRNAAVWAVFTARDVHIDLAATGGEASEQAQSDQQAGQGDGGGASDLDGLFHCSNSFVKKTSDFFVFLRSVLVFPGFTPGPTVLKTKKQPKKSELF